MIVSNIYSGGDTSRLTLPFGIEEAMPIIKGKVNKLDLTELVIDLFDGAISVNMKTGVLKPKTVHVLATNFEDEETQTGQGLLCITTCIHYIAGYCYKFSL